MRDGKVVLGITQGDMNGVGYEVALSALSDQQLTDMVVPVLYGSSRVAGFWRKQMQRPSLQFTQIKNGGEARPQRLNLVEVCREGEMQVQIGRTTASSGRGAISALEAAVEDVRLKHIDAILTMPIGMQACREAGFAYNSQSEYLSNQLGGEPFRLLVGGGLRVASVTGRVAMRDALRGITRERVEESLRRLIASLQTDFGIAKPKVAVLGLNPLVEGMSLLGNDEEVAIMPALEALTQAGHLVSGPFAGGALFASRRVFDFDAVLGMYYEQVVIPFMGMTGGVGSFITSGLPVVRTALTHGVGYRTAGTGRMGTQSFRDALYLAVDACRHRAIGADIASLRSLPERESQPTAPKRERKGDATAKTPEVNPDAGETS